MTNFENLPKKYSAEEMADTLIYGDGICVFCSNKKKCNQNDWATAPDESDCYYGIKEWLERECEING